MNWKISLLSTRNIFGLNQSASLTRWWSSLSYHVSPVFYGHWVCFLLAFRWNNFAHILYLFTLISLTSIRTWLLCSDWNLICFLITNRLIDIWSIQRLIISRSFSINLIFQIFFLIDGIVFYSGITVRMVLLHQIFEELLNSIWTFGVKILGFFHLSDLEVNFLNQTWKFVLISLFVCVKLENSFL